MRLERKIRFYEKHVKRILDVICASLFLIVFSWLYVLIGVIVRLKMGSPVLFRQPRPGIVRNGHETIFNLYKFRSMTDARDAEGNPLPDADRLPKFGAFLRSTSLDELPEIFCILKGTMSIIGPRPQLIRDMLFMTDKQRLRHTAKPGLTGLAQVKGRNAVSWEEKINWDLEYIDNVTFLNDMMILFRTIAVVLKRSGITDGENATALDYGDALLKTGKITRSQYDAEISREHILIEEFERGKK